MQNFQQLKPQTCPVRPNHCLIIYYGRQWGGGADVLNLPINPIRLLKLTNRHNFLIFNHETTNRDASRAQTEHRLAAARSRCMWIHRKSKSAVNPIIFIIHHSSEAVSGGRTGNLSRAQVGTTRAVGGR